MMGYLRVNGLTLGVEDAIAYTHILAFERSFEKSALRILLARSYAQANDLVISADAVNNLIVEWRYALGLEKRDKFAQYLADHGLQRRHLQELFEFIELEKAMQRGLPAAAVAQHYAENRQGFDRAELLLLRAEDLELLQEVRELVSEEDEKLQGFAAAYSIDAESARRGGYLGWRQRAELSGEAEAAIFAARPGELVGPFKLEGGRYEIYQVLALELPALEAVEARIRATLLDRLFARLLLEASIEHFPSAA